MHFSGVWDGKVVKEHPDYDEASLKRFTKETGITGIPKKSSDKYYPEFMEYTRSLFREHLNKYITAIHQYNPGFQITGNWAYSSLMPGKVTINQLNGKMFVNLVNIAGEHTNQTAIGYDEIPLLKDLTVSIRTAKKPAKIVLQPEDKALKFDFQNGVSKVIVSELVIHSVLEVIL